MAYGHIYTIPRYLPAIEPITERGIFFLGVSVKRIAILVDGAFFRKRREFLQQNAPADLKKAGLLYSKFSAQRVSEYCRLHIDEEKGESLYRILYYDALPLTSGGMNPVSKKEINFSNSPIAREQGNFFRELRNEPFLAVRLGEIKWQGQSWKLTENATTALLRGEIQISDLAENDVKPNMVQKGVDMRIGLDIASLAYKRIVTKIIVITGDADMVPALKLARREGVAVGVDPMRQNISEDLREHADYIRSFVPEFTINQKTRPPRKKKAE